MEPARARNELGHTPFERVLRPHMDALRRLALRLTGSPADADDLIQDLLSHLYPRAGTVVALEQPRPWLTRVLYRLFVDGWRRRRADPVVDDESEPDERAGDVLDTPDAMFERQLTAQHLQAALDGLRPFHRELLILHDVEGYTLPEVAETMEVPVGTLKSRLHRARERLRLALMTATDGTFGGAGP